MEVLGASKEKAGKLMFKTYKLIWKNNPYFYVGSTKQSLRERFLGHRSTVQSNTRYKNPKLVNVWKKYGEPDIILIAEYLTENEVLLAEQQLIDENIGIPECLNINPLAGRPHQNKDWRASKEQIEKRRLTCIKNGRCKLNAYNKKAVIAEKDDVSICFDSVREAARQIGRDHKGIIRAINGTQLTCAGFKWKYAL